MTHRAPPWPCSDRSAASRCWRAFAPLAVACAADEEVQDAVGETDDAIEAADDEPADEPADDEPADEEPADDVLGRLEAEMNNPVAGSVYLASWVPAVNDKADGRMQPYTPAIDSVISGANAAVIAGVDDVGYGAIEDGEPLETVLAASGTIVTPRPRWRSPSGSSARCSRRAPTLPSSVAPWCYRPWWSSGRRSWRRRCRARSSACSAWR